MHLKEKVKGESPCTALEYAPEKPDAPSVDGEVRIYVVEEANELLGAQECTVKAFLAFVFRGADSKDAKYFADPDDDSVLEDFVSDSEGRYLDNGGSLLDSRYLAPADGQEEEGTTLLLMAGEVPSGVLKNSEPVSGAPGLAVARLPADRPRYAALVRAFALARRPEDRRGAGGPPAGRSPSVVDRRVPPAARVRAHPRARHGRREVRGRLASSTSGDAMVQPYVLRRRRRGRVLHGSRAATLRSPSPRHYRSPRVPVRS